MSGFGFESGISTDEIVGIGGSGGTCCLASDESGGLPPDSEGFSRDSASGEGGSSVLLTRDRENPLITYLIVVE